ncbi:MAG TPA: circadian clock KaiB family protein, partial [Lamprocystis sp. (in: g-proteobacteria)]|nr:circadian clock KaiB family protein [Lamprocystis sp. (in: g-proteobacteria)]
MSTEPAVETTPAINQALARPAPQTFLLRLYVTGATPRSARAIANIKQICQEHLAGRYVLEVVDLYQ